MTRSRRHSLFGISYKNGISSSQEENSKHIAQTEAARLAEGIMLSQTRRLRGLYQTLGDSELDIESLGMNELVNAIDEKINAKIRGATMYDQSIHEANETIRKLGEENTRIEILEQQLKEEKRSKDEAQRKFKSSERFGIRVRNRLEDQRGATKDQRIINQEQQERIEALENDLAQERSKTTEKQKALEKEKSKTKKVSSAAHILLSKEVAQKSRLDTELKKSELYINTLESANLSLINDKSAAEKEAAKAKEEAIKAREETAKAKEETAKAKEETIKAREEAAKAKKDKIMIEKPIYIEKAPEVTIVEKIVKYFEPNYKEAAINLFGDLEDANNKNKIKIDYYKNRRKSVHRGNPTQIDLSEAGNDEIIAEIQKDNERAVKNNVEKLVNFIADKGMNKKVMEEIPVALMSTALAFGASDEFKTYKENHPQANIREDFCKELTAESEESNIRNKAFSNIIELMDKYGPAFGINEDETPIPKPTAARKKQKVETPKNSSHKPRTNFQDRLQQLINESSSVRH